MAACDSWAECDLFKTKRNSPRTSLLPLFASRLLFWSPWYSLTVLRALCISEFCLWAFSTLRVKHYLVPKAVVGNVLMRVACVTDLVWLLKLVAKVLISGVWNQVFNLCLVENTLQINSDFEIQCFAKMRQTKGLRVCGVRLNSAVTDRSKPR